MKQFPLALLVILLFILAGCEAEQRTVSPRNCKTQ